MTRWAKGKRMPSKDRASLRVETLENRDVPSTVTGPSSSQSPYLVPTSPGVQITSIMTVGDSVNLKPDGVTPYRMVGLADGLGAYDNYDGTFTVLMNHEIVATAGVVRAHGNAGAFVSQWVIDKSTLAVRNVRDFVGDNTSTFLSNNTPGSAVHTGYEAGSTTTFARLCAADLASPSAYQWFDPSSFTYFGTSARIFQSGEENGFGRQFAFIASDDPFTAGNDSNTVYEIPHSGLFSWENNVANPLSQLKTIVIGTDDSSPGQVYVWVGDKQSTGNVVERAGLTRQSANDNLFVIRVDGLTVDATGATNEDRNVPLNGTFSLMNEGDVSGLTGPQFESLSDSKGGTQFLRPEDGNWDPDHPSDFYFVTTDRYDQVKDGVGPQVGRSRLYRLRFTDIANPELGGSITAMLDGTESGNMFDNMTVHNGRVLLQEDPGNQQRSAKIWSYDIATDSLTPLAQHDPARFGNIGVPATAPFSLDEESSGIVSLENILGKGYFLADDQAHYPIAGELVEGGQLVVININAPNATLVEGVLTVEGTIDADSIAVTRWGHTLTVKHGFSVLGTFDSREVDTILVKAAAGNDFVYVGPNVQSDAILLGGTGNDYLVDGGGTSILIGGTGKDWLFGGSKSDLLVGGTTAYDNADETLLDILGIWAGSGTYAQRRTAVSAWLNSTTVFDDGEKDYLFGLGSLDLFYAGAGDWTDARSNETVY